MPLKPRQLTAGIERFPIAGAFRIFRGAKSEAVVVVAEIAHGLHRGRGEAVPYARYGETPEGVLAAIEAVVPRIAAGVTRTELLHLMPAGAARNAIDCALIDLKAKVSGRRAHEMLGLAEPTPIETCYTLSLDKPDVMAAKALATPYRFLKIKLGGDGDAERMAAIRRARPDARLIADANEAWAPEALERLLQVAAEAGFELIEQPLPAGQDEILAAMHRPVPVCADESVHTVDSLAGLAGRYDAVNIKLDKTGGLTAALLLAEAARTQGLRLMIGCMVATSLAMAPAHLLGECAEWVDLDGPLLLARDRPEGLSYDGGLVMPASPALWG